MELGAENLEVFHQSTAHLRSLFGFGQLGSTVLCSDIDVL